MRSGHSSKSQDRRGTYLRTRRSTLPRQRHNARRCHCIARAPRRCLPREREPRLSEADFGHVPARVRGHAFSFDEENSPHYARDLVRELPRGPDPPVSRAWTSVTPSRWGSVARGAPEPARRHPMRFRRPGV